MPIDFNIGDEVVTERVFNGDGSACLQLKKPDGSYACSPIGIRPDGKFQLFTVSQEDADALGLDRDPATGFVRWVG